MTDRAQPPNLNLPVNLPGFQPGERDPRRAENAEESWPADVDARRYAIQFREPLTEDQYEEFRQGFKLSLDNYVSELTYVEFVDPETLRQLQSHPLVNATFPFAAQYKYSPEVEDIVSGAVAPAGREIQLHVMLFPEGKLDDITATLRQLGAKRIGVADRRQRHGPSRLSFRLPAASARQTIPQIAAIDAVSWIEELSTPRDDAGAPSGLVQSGLPNKIPLTQANLRGDCQIIAVYDNGALDINHCWFKDAPPNTYGKKHRKMAWIYTLRSPGPATDHSFFVSGICAGSQFEDGHPVADPGQGIAPNAKLIYCDRNIFEGDSTPPKLLEYLNRSARRGASIHNTSWHTARTGQYRWDSADVDRFSWENEECLVIGSSGNNTETLGPPSTAKNGLCVSAAWVAGGQSRLGDGANGKTADGRRKPDLIAPGCDILSVSAAGDCQPALFQYDAAEPCGNLPGVPNGVCCAASFATPVVSGSAAIVRQYFVEGRYPIGNVSSNGFTPTGALLKAVLLNATARSDSSADYPDSSFMEGWGVLQLNRVIYPDDTRRKLWVRDVRHASGLVTGGVHSYPLQIIANDIPFKVTLVWTDPPPMANSHTQPVVNDLDLEVRAPDGNTYYLGNNFVKPGVESAKGGDDTKRDRINNVEMVLITAPTPGQWTISVRAKTAQQRDGKKQGYALAATGAFA